jgi:tripartite-type tricarboxylate transporter receptor subunit TctC
LFCLLINKKSLLQLYSLLYLTILQLSCQAEIYPNRPLRLVVPYAVGGGGDTIARLMSPKLREAMKQTVVIDNRPGGGTVIGTDLVAKSIPDGYTFLINTAAIAINHTLIKSLPYHVEKDFIPVTQLAILPNLLVVHPSLPINTVKELITYTKLNSNLSYGSSGIGTGAHLAGALFTHMSGITMIHIPYKGGGAIIPDIIAGRIQMTFATIPSSIALVKNGKVRAVAVASSKRSVALPDIPTVSEAALPGYDASNWLGIFLPSKTSQAKVMQLQSVMARVIFIPEVHDKLLSIGYEPLASTPQDFSKIMTDELKRWRQAVIVSGAVAE